MLPEGVELIGPAPAPLSRLKGSYRHHIALRGPVEAPLARCLRTALGHLTPADRRAVYVDIDPLNMG